MLAKKRYSIILEMLARDGIVHTSELMQALGVSSETVRKDLEELHRRGQLVRVHGGAVPAAPAPAATPAAEAIEEYVALTTRTTQHVEEKKRIAKKAAEMVQEGQVIALDFGSTSLLVAQALREKCRRITVVTNSIQNALLLADQPDFTVILTGGILTKDEHTLVHDFPSSLMDHIHVDILFLSVSGIDPAAGYTDQRLEEIAMQNRMRSAASKVVVVADSSKVGRTGLVRICPLNKVDALITDDGISPQMMQAIRAAGTQLFLV